MHADGKSTLASVSKWNSGKVNWCIDCKSKSCIGKNCEINELNCLIIPVIISLLCNLHGQFKLSAKMTYYRQLSAKHHIKQLMVNPQLMKDFVFRLENCL